MSDTTRDEWAQLDLSNLRLQEMTPIQRAELRRRYDAFVQHFGIQTKPEPAPARVRKWVPGERA
jgi:hypothetical protein